MIDVEAYLAWCRAHDKVACEQGWSIFESDPYRLEKIDEPEPGQTRMDSDETAWLHVLRDAQTDPACMAALVFMAKYSSAQFILWTGRLCIEQSLSPEISALIVTAHLCNPERRK